MLLILVSFVELFIAGPYVVEESEQNSHSVIGMRWKMEIAREKIQREYSHT